MANELGGTENDNTINRQKILGMGVGRRERDYWARGGRDSR